MNVGIDNASGQDSTVITCSRCGVVLLRLEGAYYDYPPEKIDHTCRPIVQDMPDDPEFYYNDRAERMWQ